MARGNRKTRYLSEISSLKELREARREIDMKLWYTGEKLADDVAETFSVDNLLSIIAPPGSVADRIVGGMSTGLATVRGIINAVQMFRSR